jgi:hypothetical protein
MVRVVETSIPTARCQRFVLGARKTAPRGGGLTTQRLSRELGEMPLVIAVCELAHT